MIKVTVVCSLLVRQGPINVLYNMLKAYAEQNNKDVEITILTLSPEEDSSRKAEFEELGIKIESLSLKPGLSTLFGIRRLRRKLLEINPDICQSSGFRADCLVSLLRLPGIKKISTLWNYPFDDYLEFGKLQGNLMAWCHLKRLRNFDRVITCSDFITERIGKYKLSISTVYTGVPVNYFVPLTDGLRREERNKMGISENADVFIYIANMIPRKNPEALIKAFQSITDKNTYLIVMGDGVLYDKCVGMNSNPNVHFVGRQPGTLRYLQISDYYVSPSLSEGFPTAVLEAMSVGLMPVLSNIPPHKEMTKGVPFDLSFEPSDANGIVNCVNFAIKKKGLFDFREYTIKNYSDVNMFRHFADIYRELIKR